MKKQDLGAATLDSATRRALADAWEADARREYVQVAELSYLSLSLLALASPPELLEHTHGAAVTQTETVEHCFGLASAYAGRTVVAGPLALPSRDESPVTFASLAVDCVRMAREDTLALAVAREALNGAVRAPVAATLDHLVRTHDHRLQLGWEVVGWCLGNGGEAARREAEAELTRVFSPTGPETLPEEILRAHGRVPLAVQQGLAEGAVRELLLRWAGLAKA